MPWYKAKDKEPYDKNQEYFLRNGGDKYIGWWSNHTKEFYQSAERGGYYYFDKEEYSNIEWWDESEEDNQAVLWDEVSKINVHHGLSFLSAIPDLKEKYTLIRK